MGYKTKDLNTYGAIIAAIMIAHGPLRVILGVDSTLPPYSGMLLLIVSAWGIIYNLLERDDIGWVYKNYKNNIHHPLIIATNFNLVWHAFIPIVKMTSIEVMYWPIIAVSVAFTTYFAWVMYQLDKN